MYTLLYFKWITHRIYYIAQGILLHIMWQTVWGGNLGENGYISCPPEVTTTLSAGYTPKQSKKFKKLKINKNKLKLFKNERKEMYDFVPLSNVLVLRRTWVERAYWPKIWQKWLSQCPLCPICSCTSVPMLGVCKGTIQIACDLGMAWERHGMQSRLACRPLSIR